MQRVGDHQELSQVRASSGGQIEATKVGVDDLICAPKLAVGGVQPVQPEYIRARTGLRHQVAWCREDGGGKCVQPVDGVIRRVGTLELGNSNVESIYNRCILEASEDQNTEAPSQDRTTETAVTKKQRINYFRLL